MQWGLWFAGMMQVEQSDRLFNCLPMYHSVGGVLAPGAMLAAGGSLVVRERFSASQFWNDITRWECTAFQYIGELCRYLLHRSYAENETAHRLRLACGNGLAASVWEAFQQRFRIPRILEFYAATEGGISLFNVQGKPGAIGHIPPYLAHRFSPALVAFDFDKGEPARNENGFCIRCGVNEPGEAIGKVQNDPASAGSRFEGYTSAAETEKRILRHVFVAGDSWVRTGDLMRRTRRASSTSLTASATPFAGRARTWQLPRWHKSYALSRAYCMPASTESRFRGLKAAPGWRPSFAKARSISLRCTGISPFDCPPTRVRFFFGSVRRPS